jgi:hypothetical protein
MPHYYSSLRTIHILIVSIVIVVFVAYCYYYYNHASHNESVSHSATANTNVHWSSSGYGNNGEHGDRAPSDEYHALVMRFGAPSALDPRPGGLAVWQQNLFRKGTSATQSQTSSIRPFVYVIIRDLHAPTVAENGLVATSEFVEAAISCHVPTHRIPDVMMLSRGIMYDSLHEWLVVSGDSLVSCTAKLALAKSVADGKITSFDAMEERMLASYMSRLNRISLEYDVTFETALLDQLDDASTVTFSQSEVTK